METAKASATKHLPHGPLGARVLVGTDLSDAADEAIRQGHERALAEGGELIVCHVVPSLIGHSPLFPQRTAEETTRMLDAERAAMHAVELRVVALTGRALGTFRVTVDTGSAEAAVVRAADAAGATLVVVSSRGATGLDRLLLGSVASRVVRYAHCPVLVARPHEKTGRILAATDFSDPALPAIAAAAEEARLRHARLTLLHSIDVMPSPAVGWGAPFGASWVVAPPEMVEQARTAAAEALRDELQRFGVDGDVLAPSGDAATAILDAARQLPADLIVLATRGRTGLTRMVLGSVAERVIAVSPCSVLAVRFATPA
jgi:nucleotide-binding universal stress UspA family protein